MTHSVIQKAVALLLLIVVGYLLKHKFNTADSVGAIRAFILNAALPATIFLSTIEIDTKLNLVMLPSFALAVNISLMTIGCALAYLLIPRTEKPKRRALILLFPSLAPGLTVYPFVEQFLGSQGLAWAALADMGNKFFVLIGLYILAIIWYQKTAQRFDSQLKPQWRQIGTFLLNEPVNVAIVAGVVFAAFHLSSASIPLALFDTIQKLALCATPLILFYVGISLKLGSLQFGAILMVLLARAGVGFLLSGAAIAMLRPASEVAMLLIALPQASCSLWSLLHATRINQQDSRGDHLFFDTEFATALLAMSFPFSIFVLLIVFSSGNFFNSSIHLAYVGSAFLSVFSVLLLLNRLSIKLLNPIAAILSPKKPVKPRPPDPDGSEDKMLSVSSSQVVQFLQSHPQQNHKLEDLNQLITRYLHSEINNPNVALHIHYLVKGRVLIVLGQHKHGSFIDLEIIFQNLKKDIESLELGFVDQIRLYFRVLEQKEPYTSHSFILNSNSNDSYTTKA
jgi:predicted permease